MLGYLGLNHMILTNHHITAYIVMWSWLGAMTHKRNVPQFKKYSTFPALSCLNEKGGKGSASLGSLYNWKKTPPSSSGGKRHSGIVPPFLLGSLLQSIKSKYHKWFPSLVPCMALFMKCALRYSVLQCCWTITSQASLQTGRARICEEVLSHLWK